MSCIDHGSRMTPLSSPWIEYVNRLFAPYIAKGDILYIVDVESDEGRVRAVMSLTNGGWQFGEPAMKMTSDRPSDLELASDSQTVVQRIFGTRRERIRCHADGRMQMRTPFRDFLKLDLYAHRDPIASLQSQVRSRTLGLASGPTLPSVSHTFVDHTLSACSHGVQLFDEVLAVIEKRVGPGKVPGLQLYVSCQSEPVLELAYGSASTTESMTVRTPVQWFCASKILIALALAQLWEEGRFDPFEPLGAHIDYMSGHGKEQLTAAHLLTHTTPIPDFLAGCFLSEPEVVRGAIADVRIERPESVGSTVNYAVLWAWYVLADLLEELTGSSWMEYVTHRILGRAGAHSTTLVTSPERIADIARTYFVRSGLAEIGFVFNDEVSYRRPLPGLNACGPISDLATVLESLLPSNKKELVRPVTAQAIVARHRVGLAEPPLGVTDWGLGFELESSYVGRRSTAFGHHCSHRTFGHRGFRSSLAFCDPAHGLVVAMHFNGLDERYRVRFLELSDAIYCDLDLSR